MWLSDSATPGGLTALIDRLSTEIGTLNTMASGYQAVAGSYTSEAKYLEQQANTLALAAQKAQPGGALPEAGDSEQTLKSLLTDLVLRDQGKVVDTTS